MKLDRIAPSHFTLFRIILGAGLFLHFVTLSPLAPELTPTSSIRIPFYQLYLPNPLSFLETSSSVRTFIVTCSILSVLFCIGFRRRLLGTILFLGFISSINGFPFMPTIRDGVLPFALLIAMLTPEGEPLSVWPESKSTWQVPSWVARWWPRIVALGVLSTTSIQLSAGGWQPIDIAIGTLFLAGALLLVSPQSTALGWLILVGLAIVIPQQRFLALLLAYFAGLVLIAGKGLLFSWRREPPLAREVFIDGDCVLCNGFGEFLLREDVQLRFRVGALQGTTAKSELPASIIGELNSIVLKDGTHVYTESAAILRILNGLGGLWSLSIFGFLIPAFIRDTVYRFIAKHRYRLFGKYEFCRLPNAQERDRLLD